MNDLKNSLVFKITIPVAITFVLIVVAAISYIPNKLQSFAINEATSTATTTVDQFKSLRAYYTKNVVKKVLAGSNMKGSFNHANDPNAIPLPAQ